MLGTVSGDNRRKSAGTDRRPLFSPNSSFKKFTKSTKDLFFLLASFFFFWRAITGMKLFPVEKGGGGREVKVELLLRMLL